MRFDCHMHTRPFTQYGDMEHFDQQAFLKDLRSAGFDGGAVYSLSPNTYADLTAEQRMDAALAVCEGQKTLFPFFWIDPMDGQAEEQVDLAVEKGFAAFKMSGILYNPPVSVRWPSLNGSPQQESRSCSTAGSAGML